MEYITTYTTGSPIYKQINHPEWGTAFVRSIERSDAIQLLRDWTWDNYDSYNESAYDILAWCIDMMESGVKGWVEYTSAELADELNRMNTDADWLYENEKDENGDECPVIFEVIDGVQG
jgi:hypothetical protein